VKPDDPVPYRITADFMHMKQAANGQWKADRLSGNVRFYVQDAQGQTLVNKTASIAKLCPT
jgi:hypothetical protein